MNVGDLKFSLFLDVRPFAESVKTVLNILSTLNNSALQSLKFQDPKINISGIDSELKKLDSTLDKYKKEVSESTNSNEKLSVSFSKTSTSSVVLNDKLQNLFLRFQGFQSSLAILKSTLGEFLGKFNQFQSALLGLESISTFKGIDPQNSKDAIKNLNLVKTGKKLEEINKRGSAAKKDISLKAYELKTYCKVAETLGIDIKDDIKRLKSVEVGD